MRRIATLIAAALAGAVLLVSGTAAGGDDGAYEVRAIFDNAAFVVEDVDVRIAGARVGVVSEVDVSGADEAARADGSPAPGKAVVVLQIEDPGFQDFRADASCLIRPQSLIGEKFVECEPTQPRSAGSEPPPPLEEIPDGEPGEGQLLLPLEQNGKAVDLDLVNDILEEPYPDRFRLILNDLGAGLAARGEELAEIVERSNPALRETNEVLGILARQNRTLAQLAGDSDQILGALARERESVSGFINSSGATAAATAERGAELEQGLQKFPGFLRELRLTMSELEGFSDAATPVFSDFGDAAPSLTRATEALAPFSEASTGALTSLGDAAEASAPDLVAADPVIRQVRGLARSGKPATRNLARLLRSLRKTDGFEYLTRLIFNTAGSVNAFDQYGHFLRALLPLNNCVDYDEIVEPGCGSNFGVAISSTPVADAARRGLRELGGSRSPDEARRAPETPRRPGEADAVGDAAPGPSVERAPDAASEAPAPGAGNAGEPPPASDAEPAAPGARSTRRMRAARDLLDFLIGRPAPARARR